MHCATMLMTFCVVKSKDKRRYLAAVLVDPLGLHVLPVSVIDPCVIRQGLQACRLQAFCHGVTVATGEAVHYARVTCNTLSKAEMDQYQQEREAAWRREVEPLCINMANSECWLFQTSYPG